MTLRASRAALVLFLYLAVAGCGGDRTYPVEGRVVWADGADAVELAGGTVSFEPVDGKASAVGGIKPDASFRLSTHREGDGAVVGTYRVVVLPKAPIDTDRVWSPPLHARFLDVRTSGLEAVVEAKTNHVTLTIERAKPKR